MSTYLEQMLNRYEPLVLKLTKRYVFRFPNDYEDIRQEARISLIKLIRRPDITLTAEDDALVVNTIVKSCWDWIAKELRYQHGKNQVEDTYKAELKRPTTSIDEDWLLIEDCIANTLVGFELELLQRVLAGEVAGDIAEAVGLSRNTGNIRLEKAIQKVNNRVRQCLDKPTVNYKQLKKKTKLVKGNSNA